MRSSKKRLKEANEVENPDENVVEFHPVGVENPIHSLDSSRDESVSEVRVNELYLMSSLGKEPEEDANTVTLHVPEDHMYEEVYVSSGKRDAPAGLDEKRELAGGGDLEIAITEVSDVTQKDHVYEEVYVSSGKRDAPAGLDEKRELAGGGDLEIAITEVSDVTEEDHVYEEVYVSSGKRDASPGLDEKRELAGGGDLEVAIIEVSDVTEEDHVYEEVKVFFR